LIAAPGGGTSAGTDVALPSLPDAAQEATDIGRLYRNADVMLGNQATPNAFLRDAQHYQIVHFAGHSIVNEKYPALSRLVMAGDPGDVDAGSLFSFQIARQSMGRTHLVILASCSGASGPSVRGEGVLSLARPFLAAGVPAVVASQWALGDRAARLLFTAFHREVSEGTSIAAALRRAQLARLKAPDAEPRDWGGVIVVGQIDDLVNIKERN
jgi:CHAT domain-containing protein